MIEGQPVNFSHKIRIVDRKTVAFHVLFPVPMSHNGVGYEWVQAASHRVGLPTVPKIVILGIHSECSLLARYADVFMRAATIVWTGSSTFRIMSVSQSRTTVQPAASSATVCSSSRFLL